MAREKRKIPIVTNDVHQGGHPADPEAAAPSSAESVPEGVTDPAETSDQVVVEGRAGGSSATSPSESGADPKGQGERGAHNAGGVEEAAPPAGDAAGDTPSPLEAAIVERDAYLDSLMRLQAEFDNYRRRSQKESTEARTRARGSLLTEFLPVFDNLARALDAAEHHEEGKVLEGVRLTHNLFAGLLGREGVSEIPALDAHFDPHLHEAVITVPSEAEEGIVVQVVEKGYTFDDKVLRPARVVVSAGPVASSGEEG
jgi:molecular chaperone GrpE